MTIVFLVCLIVGVVVGVRIMMLGVEVKGAGSDDVRPVHFVAPLAAAFSVAFGIAGYSFLRSGSLSAAGSAVVAAVAGFAAVAGVAWLVKASVAMAPEHDATDERYVLQGLVAVVTQPITAERDGEITFEIEAAARVVRARVLEGESAPVGTEVVIERIEDGIAFVEPWLQVEKRLQV